MQRRKLPKRLRRTLILSGSVLALLILLTVGILFYPFHVEVVGNRRYTEAQIKDMVMNGPISFNTLLMAKWKEHIPLEEIDYMESVDVEYLGHNTLRLHANEKYVIGYVEQDGICYSFDKSAEILEDFLDGEVQEGVPKVTGLQFSVSADGTTLEFEEPDLLNSLLALARMFEKYEIVPEEIKVGSEQDLTLCYEEVRVSFGKDENLEEKVTRLAGILPQLSGESGILHMEEVTTDTQNIIFERDV